MQNRIQWSPGFWVTYKNTKKKLKGWERLERHMFERKTLPFMKAKEAEKEAE